MRKGTDLMIKAFLEEFNEETDVRLILKDSSAVIQDYKLPTHDTRIKRIVGRIPYKTKRITSFFRLWTFPVSWRGMGIRCHGMYGRRIPVILTNYGGLADMCNKKYNYPLKVKKMVSSKPYYIRFSKIYENVGKWAEPDLNHLKN